jgi:hypothetical protein
MLASNFTAEPRRPAFLDLGDRAHLDTVKATLQPPCVDVGNRADESFSELWLDGHGITVPFSPSWSLDLSTGSTAACASRLLANCTYEESA